MSTTFMDYLKSLNLQTAERLEDVASFRRTFYIGLGGFGCAVLRSLKQHVQRLFPQHAGGFAFLGLDTHPLPPNDVLTRNEYVALSLGVSPLRVAKQHPRQLAWFQGLCGAFSPKNVTAGADRARIVGRLAFRNPPVFDEYISKLTSQASRLREPRGNFMQDAPMKVYVISTLAGGTGSGCLLDVLAVTGKLFQETETADFPYQAIVATPDVLVGEVSMGELRELYGNTYGTLKEVHHFIGTDARQIEDYDAEAFAGFEVSRHYLPQLIHFIGDKNEAGAAIVTRIEDLAEVVATYLLSEIQTPMATASGQPKVQDLENVFLGRLGLDDMPRCFSSFGVVRTGVPDDVLGHYFALRLVVATLGAETARPASAAEEAARWVLAQRLAEAGTDQLQDYLKESIVDSLKVGADPHSVLLRKGTSLDDLAARARTFAADAHSEVEASKKPLIEERGKAIEKEVVQAFSSHFQHAVENSTLGNAVAFLESAGTVLQAHQTALSHETTAAKAHLKETLDKELKLSVESLQAAAQSGYFGRKDRVRRALDDFQLRLEAMLEAHLDVWIKERGLKIYASVLQEIGKIQKRWHPCLEMLTGYAKQSEQFLCSTELRLDQMADVQRREPGNRFSLIDQTRARELYKELLEGSEAASVRKIRNEWLAEHRLEDIKSGTEKWLDGASGIVLNQEVRPVLDSLTLSAVLRRFYPSAEEQSLLFRDLQMLSSPMFWLDPNKRESNYNSYWILAVHPGQKPDFEASYSQYLPGEGVVYAFFESSHEVVLYQLKMGYTVHSHRSVPQYASVYDRMQQQYKEGLAKKKPVRPIHCWPEADEWEDVLTHREEEEALTWFIMGRAFSHLYPAAGSPAAGSRKKGTYLYAVGSNYYLAFGELDRPALLGGGLAEAMEKLAARPDWCAALREKIQSRIDEAGIQEIRSRLEQEYMPKLMEEIEIARKQGEGDERLKLLRRLAQSLQTYLQRHLVTAAV